MAGRLELHADFDRDGSISGSSTERAARLVHPGCVVVPNLDKDQRTLPGDVGGGQSGSSRDVPGGRGSASLGNPSPDYEVATAFARDNELVPIEIRVLPGGEPGPGEELVAHIPGRMHTRVRLSDSNGMIIPHRLGRPEIYVLPPVPASGVLELTLQVRTIAGGSFGRLSTLDTAFRPVPVDDDRFDLVIGLQLDDDVVVEEDRGHFSVAPAILDDCLAPVRRVYIATVPGNHPSVHDLHQAARAARIQVVEVPHDVNSGDAWLQDQYQHAHLEGPDGFREIILHLPRIATNTAVGPDAGNLRAFVEAHFRSRDVGVYSGLWTRVLPVSTADGGVVRLTPLSLAELLAAAIRVAELPRTFLQAASLLSSRASAGGPTVTLTDDWIATLRAAPDNLRALETLAATARAAAPSSRRENEINDILKRVREVVADAQKAVAVTGPEGRATVTLRVAGSRAAFTEETTRRMITRAEQMQGSAVYGGNLESTPPVPDAPLGKILLGNARLRDGADFMDPDLLRLLVAQRRQPIVELDTTWLEVGHVDEMLAVVPHRTSGFSVLHASSAVALNLLREACQLQMTGLPVEDPNSAIRRPSGILPRLMDKGPHPVTRLFRGKMWKHRLGSSQPGGPNTDVDPPRIFEMLAFQFGDSDTFNVHPIGMIRGRGERHYRADITPAEVIWCEADDSGRSTQHVLDESVLAASRALIGSELGVPILPLPVLWDRVPDLAGYLQPATDDDTRTKTRAFSPDCANLVVLGHHLVVPKPFGPRMRVDDAIAVVRTVMAGVEGLESARARVGRRLTGARRMTRETTWVQRLPRAYDTSPSGSIRRSYGGMEDLDDLVSVFKDSFPGQTDAQVAARLRRTNARFLTANGRLRSEFSPIVINDGMVDLFELFIAAVVESTGLTLHFVDSWYYHLHSGQIHCGTNVLRRPTRAGRPRVWDVPDWDGFGVETVTMDAEQVQAR